METTLTAKNQQAVASDNTKLLNSVFTDFIMIADRVAHDVYDSVSHDRLDDLRLVEVGELLGGPESMLKVVWAAKWNDGHSDSFQFLIPLNHAVSNIDAIPVRMQHRLQREVFRKDIILAL